MFYFVKQSMGDYRPLEFTLRYIGGGMTTRDKKNMDSPIHRGGDIVPNVLSPFSRGHWGEGYKISDEKIIL